MSLTASEEKRADNSSQTDVDVNEGSRCRCFFVLRMRLCKRANVPEMNRKIIWDHIRQMNELSEAIVAQEAIKLLPHQQDHSFTILIVTKEKIHEKDVLSFMVPLLAGERITTFDDPYRSFSCTPEMKISGLIRKSLRSTVTALTRIDHDCFYGGHPAGETSLFDTDYFHKK